MIPKNMDTTGTVHSNTGVRQRRTGNAPAAVAADRQRETARLRQRAHAHALRCGVAFAVLTRDPSDAAAYEAALHPRQVVAMPVVTTAPPPDPTALARALTTGPFAAIVVASPRAAAELARAVDVLTRTAAKNAREAAVLTGRPGEIVRAVADSLHAGATAVVDSIWAVGPATERALATANLAARHPPGVRSGAELAHALVAAVPLVGKRVLVPRAEQGRTEAIDILRAAGADVVDVIAYRTVPTAPDDPAIARGLALLRAGNAEICAVFAPSQVAALAALVGPLTAVATQFCAIGETTAAALHAAGVRRVAVASEPTPEGLAAAICATDATS